MTRKINFILSAKAIRELEKSKMEIKDLKKAMKGGKK